MVKIKGRKLRSVKPVPQEHPLGCAVACVACICRVSYQSAFSFFSTREHAWTRGYYCSELVDALAKAGLKYQYSKYETARDELKALKEGTIVFIEPCKSYPAGHFFARTKKGWMNPWVNFPQMNNIKAAFEENLQGKISYIVFESDRSSDRS
jgi:ABC-type bacteriocin/lantibiotic exporter with double-glycine peptidase domain